MNAILTGMDDPPTAKGGKKAQQNADKTLGTSFHADLGDHNAKWMSLAFVFDFVCHGYVWLMWLHCWFSGRRGGGEPLNCPSPLFLPLVQVPEGRGLGRRVATPNRFGPRGSKTVFQKRLGHRSGTHVH